MHIIDLINKKKYGGEFTGGEIKFFVDGVVNKSFQDYQVSALLMAIWCRGMSREETVTLTLAMAESGDMIDLGAIDGIKVDKHSTGGVADTTTLIAAPLAAACGAKVAKMSGRGLGHTGGTIDKLESIPGFQVSLSMDDFIKAVSTGGLAVIGQTASLVPADKILYSLRDVTGTIDCLPLIASSIMSKKLASGSNAVVLDVKTGSGAFMKTARDSQDLARIMVDIGNDAGRNTRALVTNMDQPLGLAVGNALEVQEAIEILSGNGGGDLLTVSMALAGQMLIVSEICADEAEAEQKLKKALESGNALETLGKMIEQQGGDRKILENTTLLPQAGRRLEVFPPADGYLTGTDAEAIGRTAQLLGAGRMKKSDIIDPAVGLWMKTRIGQEIKTDIPAAVFYINNEQNLEEAREIFRQSLKISPEKPAVQPLIYGDPVS